MHQKVGFSGPAGVGKSTFATSVGLSLQKLGFSTYDRPFAGPLKLIAKQMGWNGEKDEKGRRLLQLLGTECGRECIGENCWIDMWKERRPDSREIYLADDVRFQNEVDVLDICFRLDRSGNPPPISYHASEAWWMLEDVYVVDVPAREEPRYEEVVARVCVAIVFPSLPLPFIKLGRSVDELIPLPPEAPQNEDHEL